MLESKISISIGVVNEFLNGLEVDDAELLESIAITAFYLSTLEIYASKSAKKKASAETLRQYELGLVRGCSKS